MFAQRTTLQAHTFSLENVLVYLIVEALKNWESLVQNAVVQSVELEVIYV